MNVNERISVAELQVTACVFGLTYAFRLMAGDMSNGVAFLRKFLWVYDLPFCRYKALKSPTRYFDDALRTQLPVGAFHHLGCQTIIFASKRL